MAPPEQEPVSPSTSLNQTPQSLVLKWDITPDQEALYRCLNLIFQAHTSLDDASEFVLKLSRKFCIFFAQLSMGERTIKGITDNGNVGNSNCEHLFEARQSMPLIADAMCIVKSGLHRAHLALLAIGSSCKRDASHLDAQNEGHSRNESPAKQFNYSNLLLRCNYLTRQAMRALDEQLATIGYVISRIDSYLCGRPAAVTNVMPAAYRLYFGRTPAAVTNVIPTPYHEVIELLVAVSSMEMTVEDQLVGISDAIQAELSRAEPW